MAGSAERQLVLKMLQEGRIGAEDAEKLLAALGRAEQEGTQRPQEDRSERTSPEGESERPPLDLGGIGRGIREAVRGLTEGLRTLTEKAPWGDLGDWFRSTLGGVKSTLDQPITVPPDAAVDRIVVKGANGKIAVRGVAQGFEGHARITAWGSNEQDARQAAEEIRVFTSVRDGVLEISFKAASGEGDSQRHRVDLDLGIADACALEATTTSGVIEVADTASELALHTASGDIRLAGARGRTTIVTSSGTVRGDQTGADRLDVRSSSGDVILSLAPGPGASVRISTASGDVVLRLAPTAKVRVEATTSSGEVAVRAPLRVEELGRSRFVGVQGEADGTVHLSSASGDLRIEGPGA